ncbi:unnamed protein product [Trifolium pratense]|uniref:Uncharacterized protein n=1 Tax=Trifolium pratense TaxID=57577 RepID=A0ACB0L8B1_TRIPR|nr:unnamed protein product [Trifolium pratense]
MQCRRRALWRWLLQQQQQSRSSSSSSSVVVDEHLQQQQQQQEVLVKGNGYSRFTLLNRPSALNAINTSMAARLHQLYKNWEDNHDIYI